MKKTFEVRGMHCASCVRVIERTLQKVKGVKTASVNLATNKATVNYDEQLSEHDMASAVKNAGYDLMVEEKPMEGRDNLKEHVTISIVLV